MKTKKIALATASFLCAINLIAQGPTGSPPTGSSVPVKANAAWYRGGNDPTIAPGGFNIFGFNGSNPILPIWYQTNALSRMLMMGGGNTNTDGRIAMGNNIPAAFIPQARLHLLQFAAGAANADMFRTDGNQNAVNQWQLFTGTTTATATQKGRLFVPVNSNNFNMESTLGSIEFYAAGGNATAPNNIIQQRVIISNGDYLNAANAVVTANVTRVGISYGDGIAPIITPNALLHLGYSTSPGYRNWMDVGMYIAKGDNMYVGLKEEGNNRQDAVINWGDDGVAAGPDNLRFIFTTNSSGPAPAFGFDGFETGRITPFGNWGIGNFFNNPLFPFGNPVRKMEILSDKAVANANGNPQLRLTNFQQDPLNPFTTGRYAELHETSIGDLGILALDNTLSSTNTVDQTFSERFVGINTISPGNSLEINSQFTFPTTANGQTPLPSPNPLPTGWAGLRFTDLTSISSPQVNPGTGVLSVDANGDVIYVPNNANTFGGICGSATPLTQSWEVPIDPGVVYNFSSKGNVNITDVTNCTPTAAKLFVSTIANASIAAVNNNAGGFAGYFLATGSTGTGVYCRAPVTSPPLPIPPATPPPASLALFADGDVFVSGTAFLANPAIVSDQQFKTNLDSIQSAMDIVKQLKPRTFEYINDAHFSFPAGRSYGFIAQDVEQVIPELVKETVAPPTIDSMGNQILAPLPYKTLNYQGIIPVLTKAIQEQQTQISNKDSIINNLNDRLTALENCINALNLCGTPQAVNQNNNNSSTAITTIDLKDGQAIVLEQNVPNPFAEQTTINYFLPETVAKAQMLFYNAQGKLIQTVDLTQKGKGSINVFAQDLSTGIYTYTLVADGQIVETKKMIKQ